MKYRLKPPALRYIDTPPRDVPPIKRNTCHPSDKQKPDTTHTLFPPGKPPRHPSANNPSPAPNPKRESRHHLTHISRQHQASGTSPSPRHARLSLTPHPERHTRHHPAYVSHRHRTSETCPSLPDAHIPSTPSSVRRFRHHPSPVSRYPRPSKTFPSPTRTRLSPTPCPTRETRHQPHTHRSLAPSQRDIPVTNPHASLTRAETSSVP